MTGATSRAPAFALSSGSRSPGAATKRALSILRRACLSAGAGPFVLPKATLLPIAAAMRMEGRR